MSDEPFVVAGKRSGKTAHQIERAYEEGRREGHEEGLQQGRQEILDWLENAYIKDPGRPDRGTPKAEAILELVTAAQNHFIKKLDMGRRTKKAGKARRRG